MKKKINLAKITSFVLLLTVTAMILVAGTYAKYSSTASGTDATVIAKWSFKVNGTEIAVKGDKPTVAFDLFETINDTSTGEVETDVADGLIAPGTSGAFEFKLENSSEVTTKYAINLEVKEGANVPLQFSIDGGQNWTDVANLSDLVATDVMGIGTTKNVTVQWQWVFDGDTDATLGGQKVEVTANITATQVDNSDVVIDDEPEVNVLEGKSAIFFGDSVAYGHETNGNGFGYYVNEIASFSNYKNAAVNTATLNTESQGTNNVIEQMKNNKENSYDYVIIQGGYGDLRDTPELGELTSGYVVNEFDTTTFAGAVEYTLYLATTYWEDAKIGFIVSWDAPKSTMGIRADYEATKEYWDLLKAGCDKWNVDYLDFFEGSTTYNGETKTYSELFDVTGTTYLAADGVHPTATGYEFIAPFIAEWMKTLPAYERDFEITTDSDSDQGSDTDQITSFSQLTFTKNVSFDQDGLTGSKTGRACAINQYVSVNGGEVVGLSDSATGVTYALLEFDENMEVTTTGEHQHRWIEADENVTLQADTRFIAVSFKNGDGTTSFTDEQIALLPTYIEFK